MKAVSVSRVIPASPQEIFAVLADPTMHAVIDGSQTVKASLDGNPAQLSLGASFRMDMRRGVGYRIRNTVVEFEQDRLIAWSHLGKHRWRYQLEPAEGGTKVTETFDWSTARAPWLYDLVGFAKRNLPGMEATLERLDHHFRKER